MRTHVIFDHPAAWVPVSEEDGILSVEGATWFVNLLEQVPDLTVDPDLCQEDWGVVVFATRNNKRFWIGLSFWGEDERRWCAHVHHHSFAWLQRVSASGRTELRRLIQDVHGALNSAAVVSHVSWLDQHAVDRGQGPGSPNPI